MEFFIRRWRYTSRWQTRKSVITLGRYRYLEHETRVPRISDRLNELPLSGDVLSSGPPSPFLFAFYSHFSFSPSLLLFLFCFPETPQSNYFIGHGRKLD